MVYLPLSWLPRPLPYCLLIQYGFEPRVFIIYCASKVASPYHFRVHLDGPNEPPGSQLESHCNFFED